MQTHLIVDHEPANTFDSKYLLKKVIDPTPKQTSSRITQQSNIPGLLKQNISIPNLIGKIYNSNSARDKLLGTSLVIGLEGLADVAALKVLSSTAIEVFKRIPQLGLPDSIENVLRFLAVTSILYCGQFLISAISTDLIKNYYKATALSTIIPHLPTTDMVNEIYIFDTDRK